MHHPRSVIIFSGALIRTDTVVPICCLVLYSPSKKLVFVSVASAMAGANRDCLVLASNARGPEI